MNWDRLCGFLGGVGIVLFFLSAFTPLPNVLTQRLEVPSHVEPAGAIVVLGAGVSLDGMLSSDSLRRVIQGVLLQRKGLAPLLVLSGPAFKGGPTEAEVRAELAKQLGVPSEAILTEAHVWTTREEAIRIKALLESRGVRSILLVTDSQHLVRARVLFERAGLEVFPVAADDVSDLSDSPEGRLKLTRRAFQEIVARVYYRLAGYL